MKAVITSLLLLALLLAGCQTHPANPVNPAASTEPQQKAPPSPTTQNPAALSWDDCVKTPGSVIEQTYPEICVAPDGRKAVHPK